ncbi:MAG: methyl-accepting chemotaxis protein [Lachnospiraceae bacterium]|nr:methyl-accepting chemotaxis protein [Lachnospiraceae bacterium]
MAVKKIKEKKTVQISMQLLIVLVPLMVFAIAIVTTILTVQARKTIVKEATEALQQETNSNANDIAEILHGISRYYDGITDVLQKGNFENDKEIEDILAESMTAYDGVVTDVYIGFDDKNFIDGSHWVPDADYDPTTRGWYQNGEDNEKIALLPPSLDMTTGAMVSCGSRSIKLKDGRSGVLSIDIVLAGISELVGGYTPRTTGKSILFSETNIIASGTEGYAGTDASDHPEDTLLQNVAAIVDNGLSSEVLMLSDGTENNFVAMQNVSGTDWILVSYVKEKDVLGELNAFVMLAIIVAIIIVIVAIVIQNITIKKLVASPVQNLTSGIIQIASGDFTLELPKGGTNEVGVMNSRMSEYITNMRKTLVEIKSMADDLASEAENSKEISQNLSNQATHQASSMQRVQHTMDDMSKAVNDLALNATSLAGQVSELRSHSNVTKSTMTNLVETAQEGQRNMMVIKTGMSDVSDSMHEMNAVVKTVDESANKINSIIDMINSISNQTNLLSLNASIEAARAGEAGRGFAVVAGEIGALANNSAESTKQISEIIKDITSQIYALSNKANENVEKINSNIETVNTAGDTFEKIFESLDEASSVVGDMIDKIQNVDEIATSMAAISQEQSASTQEVTSTAGDLTEEAEKVAENSKNVDRSATAVSESSLQIEELVGKFKI